MGRIEIGQEIFYVHNHYWKDGDELPEIRVGIVFPSPQGMEGGTGYSVRPKKHKNSAITTVYLQDREVFVTKEAAHVKLLEEIKGKIRKHAAGTRTLWKCYHKAIEQLAEDLKDLKGDPDDRISDQTD